VGAQEAELGDLREAADRQKSRQGRPSLGGTHTRAAAGPSGG
jgi:hypothetical protein